MKYDWKKITTIAVVNYVNTSLLCYAHSHGVKIVYLGMLSSQIHHTILLKLYGSVHHAVYLSLEWQISKLFYKPILENIVGAII